MKNLPPPHVVIFINALLFFEKNTFKGGRGAVWYELYGIHNLCVRSRRSLWFVLLIYFAIPTIPLSFF